MGHLVDTRSEDKGDTHISSRKRFEARYKKNVEEAHEKALADSKIGDVGKDGFVVRIPRGDLHEPSIQHGPGGRRDVVLSGNKNLKAGDRFPRPSGGGGGSGDGDGDEAGEGDGDTVAVVFSPEDFRDKLFHDLELPNQVKKLETDSPQTEFKRAGYSSQGPHSRLDVRRSLSRRNARRDGAARPLQDRIIELLSEEEAILAPLAAAAAFALAVGEMSRKNKIAALVKRIGEIKPQALTLVSSPELERITAIDKEVADLKERIGRIPKWDENFDLRYRHFEEKPVPITKAVVFCEMDVSGSMDEETRKRAKIFFWLLQHFLKMKYEHVDIVYIRHTDVAEEVDEETFFDTDKSGGTRVSSIHEKKKEIIPERYPPAQWNIFGAHASDGDNAYDDNKYCCDLLRELLPGMQAYFYTHINERGTNFGGLWDAYEVVAREFPDQFFMGRITDRKDIWPLFRRFFSPQPEGAKTAPRPVP